MRFLKKLIALWRVERGYCPKCNSSPPTKKCTICKGDYEYGPTKDTWHFYIKKNKWLCEYFLEVDKKRFLTLW